jgi:type IV pilus assembly protein PilO
MKLLFSKKEIITLSAVVLILVIFVGFLQFYFLSPLKSDLKVKEQTLKNEQKLLAAMQKNAGNNDQAEVNTTELQEEVPVKPLQDQFIIDLQKAEAVSNSQIKSMSFADGGQAAAATAQTAPTAANTNQSQSSNSTVQTNPSSTSAQQNNQTTTNGATGQQTAQNTVAAQASVGSLVNKLTVQLSIQAPQYEDLEKFINTLEGLKRITVVEAINYTGDAEIKSLDQNKKPLDFTLTISAYYIPSLTDLEKQLPKVDFPAPANKDNPLSQFANTNSN